MEAGVLSWSFQVEKVVVICLYLEEDLRESLNEEEA